MEAWTWRDDCRRGPRPHVNVGRSWNAGDCDRSTVVHRCAAYLSAGSRRPPAGQGRALSTASRRRVCVSSAEVAGLVCEKTGLRGAICGHRIGRKFVPRLAISPREAAHVSGYVLVTPDYTLSLPTFRPKAANSRNLDLQRRMVADSTRLPDLVSVRFGLPFSLCTSREPTGDVEPHPCNVPPDYRFFAARSGMT